ncbi:MAG: hypothetical protein F9K21_00505 [Rhodocyclaceae bacterium]|nr:MAG: hypothetical protein F9K21_00505 [Rhodocyclaceae bacterium]CAG0926971.1 hypothetical protein RHDC3_00241 [Rhodocyclaceae bacterium]
MGTRVITIRVTDAAFNQIVGEAEKKNATVADHVRQILSESMNTQMQNARVDALEAKLLQEFQRLQKALSEKLDSLVAEAE